MTKEISAREYDIIDCIDPADLLHWLSDIQSHCTRSGYFEGLTEKGKSELIDPFIVLNQFLLDLHKANPGLQALYKQRKENSRQ